MNRTHFLDYPDTFIWIFCVASGHFPNYLEILQPIMSMLQKLSGFAKTFRSALLTRWRVFSDSDIHMDEEQRADVHPFLVIELVTTYMYMDEEHCADFHPFLVILCAHYLFVAQYTLVTAGYICHSVHRRPRLLHHLLQASAATLSRHTHCKHKFYNISWKRISHFIQIYAKTSSSTGRPLHPYVNNKKF